MFADRDASFRGPLEIGHEHFQDCLDRLKHIFVYRISVEAARCDAGSFFECFQIEGEKVIGLYGTLRCATRQDGFATSRKSRDVV